MNRQYIGARYVPKFSEPIEWNKDNSYEALTIVTYLNNSYTSKKPVPVGVEITNTEYWVVTGNYNAQVEEYRQTTEKYKQTTEEYKKEVDSYVEELTDTNNTVNRLTNKRVIFISDSYGASTSDWIGKAVKRLGLTENNYYKNAISGYGFHPSYNAYFINLLKDLATTVSNPSTITDIVVGGGFNDRSTNKTDLENAISEFCSYAKNTYPNAKIWIGAFGWSFNNEFVAELINGEYLRAYKNCALYGAVYLNGSDYIMHFKDNFFKEDKGSYNLYLEYQYVHPNDKGANLIANCVYSNLIGNGFEYNDRTTFSITTKNSTAQHSITVTQYLMNNRIQIDFSDNINLTFDDLQSCSYTDWIDIATIDNGMVAGSNASGITNIYTLTPAFVAGGSFNGNTQIPVMVKIANNRLYVRVFDTPNNNFKNLWLSKVSWSMDNIFA